MSRSDTELIARYIDTGSSPSSPDEARVLPTGTHVWAVIGYWRANDEDIDITAVDYALPTKAVLAAVAYYQRNREVINARLLLDLSSFTAAD